jgi:hypothetical protein
MVLGCSAVFDLLFLFVGTLPATVPVAVALVILEIRARRLSSGRSSLRRQPPLARRESHDL